MSLYNALNNPIDIGPPTPPIASIIHLIKADPLVGDYLNREGFEFSDLNSHEKSCLYNFYQTLKTNPEDQDFETLDARNHRPMIDMNKFVFNRLVNGVYTKLLNIDSGAVIGVDSNLARKTTRGVLASSCVQISAWCLRETMRKNINVYGDFEAIHKALQITFELHGFRPDWITSLSTIPESFLSIINVDLSHVRGRRALLHSVMGSGNSFTAPLTTTAERNLPLAELMSDVHKVTTEFIKQDAARFFRVFMNSATVNFPDVKILGAGSGDDTQGLMDVSLAGMFFFQYNYFDPFDPSRRTPQTPADRTVFNPVITNRDIVMETPGIGKEAVLHLSSNGLENVEFGDPRYPNNTIQPIIKIKNVSCCLDRAATFPFKKAKFIPVTIPLGTFTWANMPPANQASFSQIGATNRWSFFDPATGSTIAVYNSDTSELEFTSDGTAIELSYGSGWEESFLIATLVAQNINALNFNLNSFFETDKFEIRHDNKLLLETYLRDTTIGVDMDNNTLFMLSYLSQNLGNGVPLACQLKGRFVGVATSRADEPIEDRIGGVSRVISDRRYWFLMPTTPPTPNPSLTHEDTSGMRDELRTSFIKMKSGTVQNEITIDSYVTPSRSRLDLMLNTTDYRLTAGWIDPTYQGQLAGRTPGLDSKTLFTDPTLLPHTFYSWDGNGTLASYNPVLASLRSIGALEAIIDIILKNSSYDHKLCDVLLTQLSNTVVPTDVVYGTRAPITYQEYSLWRWYDSENTLRGGGTATSYYYLDANELRIIVPGQVSASTNFNVYVLAINTTDQFIDRQFNGTIVLDDLPNGFSNLPNTPVNIVNGVGSVTIQCAAAGTFSITSNGGTSLTQVDAHSNITSFPDSSMITVS